MPDNSIDKDVNTAFEPSALSLVPMAWAQYLRTTTNGNSPLPQTGRQLGAQPWWKTHQKQASGNSHTGGVSNKYGDEIVAKSTASATKNKTPSKLVSPGTLPGDASSSPNAAEASSSYAAKGDKTYANGGDGFFKGNSGVAHGSAAWDFLNDHHNALRWPSSWRRQQNGSDALAHLCGPFQNWLQHSYIPRARQRAPIVCSMVPHQGLGDQFKGVTRCWAAALITQRPLYFDHGKSR